MVVLHWAGCSRLGVYPLEADNLRVPQVFVWQLRAGFESYSVSGARGARIIVARVSDAGLTATE